MGNPKVVFINNKNGTEYVHCGMGAYIDEIPDNAKKLYRVLDCTNVRDGSMCYVYHIRTTNNPCDTYMIQPVDEKQRKALVGKKCVVYMGSESKYANMYVRETEEFMNKFH